MNPPGPPPRAGRTSAGGAGAGLALAAAGLVALLVVGGLAKVLRAPTATTPSAQATAAESADTAQRFLTSARESLAAKDYELAALQLQKAIEELRTAGASAAEIDAAKLMLARARFREGKLEQAHELCAELAAGAKKAEARALGGEIRKALRQQAEATLASGRSDLSAGRLSRALEKARKAEKVMTTYQGSPDQIARARALLTSARKAEGGLGLAPPRSAPRGMRRTVVTQSNGSGERVVRTRPRGGQSYPQYRPPEPTPFETEDMRGGGQMVLPANSPMAQAMRRARRPAPAAGQTAPSAEEAPAQEGAPEAAPPASSPGPAASSSSSSSYRRQRAGSADVLPSYNAQGGGSVY